MALAGGTAVVSFASTLSAAAAFLIGRYAARDWVGRKVEGSRRMRAIDEAVGVHGWKLVLLLRLSPVFPYNLLNYALGLTRVRFLPYIAAS